MSKSRITYRFERAKPGSTADHNGYESEDGVIVRRYDQHAERDAMAMTDFDAEHTDEFSDDIDDDILTENSADTDDIAELSEFSEFNDWPDESSKHYSSEFSAWQSPYDIETEQLEKLIRGETSSQAEVEKVEENIRSIEGDRHKQHDESHIEQYPGQGNEKREQAPIFRANVDEDDTYEFDDRFGPELVSDKSITTMVRDSRRRWAKLFLSVSGAMVTGVVFGLFVLSLFNGGGSLFNNTPEILVPVDQQAQIVEREQLNTLPGIVLDHEHSDFVSVNVPSKDYYVLQNGMFSSQDGAQAAMQQLADKGYAGASEQLDHHYVYAGIAAHRDDALVLSHQLQRHDFETYIKTLTIPAVSQIAWDGTSISQDIEQIENYFIQGSRLVDIVSNLAVIQLQQESAMAIDSNAMSALMDSHQAWVALSSFVYEGVPEASKPTVQKVSTALNTTVLLLEAYRKNPSFAYLWQAQAALIDYVVHQKALIEGMSKHNF